ncbi:putative NAD(P)/FAD-binding protein YdhS [Sphingomonas jejuensis]|uniref:NAD(P)/FAD-binding protein YdhS n=1 Tax=Sphingomonas jejuensis TaxID=904715 RepID=A0ABX0XLZ3_9SPHN|nr:FAD/NAD(P)-binding protein [Sphingomonas jejuensis]NJC33726.1 putative NAD(P)/FAD-binding protein YdhS [Sphingomonas jejuensis]
MQTADVLIVGAGASGTLLGVHLLGRGASVILVERHGRLEGRGVAYGEAGPLHLLNVRAAGMSAYPDRPDHFAAWLEAKGRGAGTSFALRRDYGDYLVALLADAETRGPGVLERVDGEIVDLQEAGDGVTAILPDGRHLHARHAVIASGNLPPLPPPGIDQTLPPDIWVADPWASDPASGLRDADHVVLVGTGLTAVDVAVQLDAAGFGGKITAVSRRGLMPRVHADPEPRPAPPTLDDDRLSGMLRRIRRLGDEIGWRAAVDALRPVTQPLWQEADLRVRRRFLRHLRPWWDVHRHRIAPQVGERLAAMAKAGRLEVLAARTFATVAEPSGVALTIRRRGASATEVIHARRLVNCTGPGTDVSRSGDPLLTTLLQRGTVRSGPLRLGVEVSDQCDTLDSAGAASSRIHAIGPITRERFWEVVAVPDIRQQAAVLAARLAPDQ